MTQIDLDHSIPNPARSPHARRARMMLMAASLCAFLLLGVTATMLAAFF